MAPVSAGAEVNPAHNFLSSSAETSAALRFMPVGGISIELAYMGHTMGFLELFSLESLRRALEKKEPNPLPDDSEDFRDEIIVSLGREWLHTKNAWLNLKTPDQVIGTPEEDKLRDLVRSILVASLS